MSATRAHGMPFGARVTGDGVDFGLWAPEAVEAAVVCGESFYALEAEEGGWFRRFVPGVEPGALYGYLVKDRRGGRLEVPDPASRYQPADVHGPSMVIDPESYEWTCAGWEGRAWEETVLYEIHVGTFTPQGTFAGVEGKLDYLADLGVTAVELMPVADFAGSRNWGYDGVLPFAPDSAYGTPQELKRLVDAAHERGIMLFLDVVYNHFGPEGNYLHVYAPQFFTERVATPWGAAIDFGRRDVREFFIHNALYWLEEFGCDGLRLDAVHAIHDGSDPHILEELADRVGGWAGEGRYVHLVLENDANEARYLERTAGDRPPRYRAQWNDDGHHSLHVGGTGESGGYYFDYADDPVTHLGRSLAEGFAYQGECSPFRGGRARGEPSRHLPPSAFVLFLQNHDQVGNRAFGERISALAGPEVVEALTAVYLLAPSPPLLFMGEEWAAPEPFLFFCDFDPDLGARVREGRRREFEQFPEFRDETARERIPDPNDMHTFARSVLDWGRRTQPTHSNRLDFFRRLLALRREKIAPVMGRLDHGGTYARWGDGGLAVDWTAQEGGGLHLRANLSSGAVAPFPPIPDAEVLLSLGARAGGSGRMPPWAVIWLSSRA